MHEKFTAYSQHGNWSNFSILLYSIPTVFSITNSPIELFKKDIETKTYQTT